LEKLILQFQKADKNSFSAINKANKTYFLHRKKDKKIRKIRLLVTKRGNKINPAALKKPITS
jgi:hypothetical protein